MSGAAAEYDVLVHLKVSRESQKAMGVAAGTFRATMRRAAADQKAMTRAELARTKAADREKLKALGVEARRKRQHEAVESRVARQAERGRKRREASKAQDAKRARADAAKRRAEFGGNLGKSTTGAGGFFSGIGTGGAAAWAGRAAGVITTVLAGGVAAGLGMALKGGLDDNIGREALTGKIGTTLQLFDFNATGTDGKAQSMGDQYAENLENARWYQQELQRIADSSPGDIGQVTDLFGGMLPGMAAITQDAERITNLTQKTTLLAAVLGNNFAMVGEQSSRILSGGAGAEMETWRTALQKPIRDAGILEGSFKKSQALGEKLTMAFNKLAPEKRMELFEKALEKLGKPVSDYFENSWDGIMSQAKSSLMMIRRELGRAPFEMLKNRVKEVNKSGLLKRGSEGYKGLMDFAGFLGQRVGTALVKGIDIAERAGDYIGRNWENIVLKAQTASHYLVEGAKTAVSLMGVKMGVGAAAAGVGAVTKGASAIAGIASMGAAALVAGPAFLAAGVAVAGFGIMFGGIVTYVVSNLDDLSGKFTSWTQTAGDVIDPFFMSIDTLAAKFEAMGAYLLGAGDGTDIFTGAVTTGTSIVEGLTTVFSELIGMTASVIETFAGAADFMAGIFGGLNAGEAMELSYLYEKQASMGMQDQSPEAYAMDARIAELEASTRTYTEKAAGVVSTIRGAKEAFDGAKGGNGPSAVSWMAYEKMYPMGPASAPRNTSTKTPPKINVTQNIKNTIYIKDVDPNAVVAAHNKDSNRRAALGIRSALAMTRRN